MGLCRCQKRRVTNLFCFVHQVNVCEDCMITQHHRCVVQSYLKWLEDADYDPICVLCTKSIQEGGDVVRLVCYDVYHVACLDAYGRSLPPNTAPAGFLCPKCKDPLLPPANMVSPVANRLRIVLQAFNWATATTGLATPHHRQSQADSLFIEEGPDGGAPNFLSPMTSTPRPPHPSPHSSLTTSNPPPFSHNPQAAAGLFEQQSASERSGGMGVRDSYPAATGLTLSRDIDDNKYHRKNPMEMLSRWIKHHHWQVSADDSTVIMRRYLIMAVAVIFLIVMLIVILTRVGRDVASRDPNLDWRMNPNLRTGD